MTTGRPEKSAAGRLKQGYLDFRRFCLGQENAGFLAGIRRDQAPEAMVIACSDSRVSPALLTRAAPGEIFVVRNIAGLVPPFQPGVRCSVGAALLFAVDVLRVTDVIVLGHSNCGGIAALMHGEQPGGPGLHNPVGDWMRIAGPARDRTRARFPGPVTEAALRCCERESLLASLRNLRSFPWTDAAIREGRLAVHAWYFDTRTAELECHDPEKGDFFRVPDDADAGADPG